MHMNTSMYLQGHMKRFEALKTNTHSKHKLKFDSFFCVSFKKIHCGFLYYVKLKISPQDSYKSHKCEYLKNLMDVADNHTNIRLLNEGNTKYL